MSTEPLLLTTANYEKEINAHRTMKHSTASSRESPPPCRPVNRGSRRSSISLLLLLLLTLFSSHLLQSFPTPFEPFLPSQQFIPVIIASPSIGSLLFVQDVVQLEKFFERLSEIIPLLSLLNFLGSLPTRSIFDPSRTLVQTFSLLLFPQFQLLLRLQQC